MDLVSFGNKRTYEDFKKEIPIPIQPLFDSIREVCLSLGKNVVEDVRMHRIVFGKSMTFRWFADAEPQENGIMIKIQKSRKETPQIIHIKLEQDVTELEEILKEAYETVR
ncbi:MAG TPA: hypothetical protein ENH95_03785 [Nitrosopumilus sp.]|nr:hypothetical protein [Nitrosopumilus sp.]